MIFTLLGLVFDVVGALLLATLLFVSKERAEELSQTVYGKNPLEKQDRLRQSKAAKWGISLIVIGFILQILGFILCRI